MSLFKARDWWSTTAGENEEFDLGCLVVAKLIASDTVTNPDQIITGSFSGIIRVYNPEHSEDRYKPESLLVEQDLGNPIIQLECGKFVPSLEVTALAVLHPRRLSIYTVTSTAGAVSHGTQYKLQFVYSHNLQRSAFNMCYGPFGQVQNKDFICVQSIDGALSVFEQETFSFIRFLPDSLLPGPLVYLPSSDNFITVSSSRCVESYKYQMLAAAADTKTKEEAQSIKSGKRVAVDWSLCIGEQAISLEVLSTDPNNISVLVLGERSLFCVNEFGKLKFMKKLEYTPRCMKLYQTSQDSVSYMIASHTKTLMIYSNTTLKWAAQLDTVPVSIAMCSMGAVSGGIVTLDELGKLNLQYLGTDPAMMVMPSTQYRETKYDEYADEIKRYQQIIREKSSTQAVLPTKLPDDDVTIVVHIPSHLDSTSQSFDVQFRNYDLSAQELDNLRAEDVEFKDDDPVPSITVKIEIKVKMMLNDVTVNVHLDKPMATTMQTEFEFPSISANSPATVIIPVFMRYNFLPTSLQVDISAKYTSSTGVPKVAQSHMLLPLKLVVKPAPPVKSAMFKVTIDTNKPPVNLNEIFTELLGMNTGGQGAALGFQFFGGPLVTLLASKTSQRYRLQSDDFAAMWLLTKEFIDRLHVYFGRNSGLKCSHSASLPLQEYFESIDAHFEYRMHALKYKELLEQRALQFRAIQRRLLTRFKDKTPAPLSYLDTLLEGTFRQLIAIAEHAQDNKNTLNRSANNLSCATRLLTYLVKLSCDMSDDDYVVLQSVLTPDVFDNGDQGWEEMVDTALTHQLRTRLSKTTKDHNVNTEMIGVGQDTSKLKKHIAIFIEKLSKGAKLSDRKSGADEFDTTPPVQKASGKVLDKRNFTQAGDDSVGEVVDTPVGTRLGQKSSPRAPAAAKLKPLNGSLPPLLSNGGGDLENRLPPLQGGAKLKPIGGAKIDVPDLDELTNSA